MFKKFSQVIVPIGWDDPKVGKGSPFVVAETLASHVITSEAQSALLSDDFERFLALRERDLVSAERSFASQYVDVASDDVEIDEEPEIDVEDESEPDL